MTGYMGYNPGPRAPLGSLGPRLYGGVRMVDRPAPDNVARMDHNAMRCITRMAANGIAVDRGRLRALGTRCTLDMVDLANRVEELTGVRCNPASGDQVADLLFRRLGLGAGKIKKLVRSGKRESTTELDIEPYLSEHPVVAVLYEWRERQKIQSTYVEPLIEQAREDRHGNWLVKTEILWTRTGTGRYASKGPNLQNIPVRTALGLEVRNAFIARVVNGRRMRLVTVDQSQIEMRVAAHESNARRMVEVFHLPELLPNGKKNKLADVHVRTAMSVFRIDADAVHPMKHRYPMKRAGFGILYGITEDGLAVQLNNPEAQDPAAPHVWTGAETGELITGWYGEYPEILEMQQLDEWRVLRYGMGWDMFGRHRLIPEVRSSLTWVVEAGLRQAKNHRIQAGAGGTLKLASARVADEMDGLRRMGVYVEPLMTIHDEILSETEPEIADDVGRMVGRAIEDAAPLRVPIKWGAGSGDRWGELEK